MQADFAPCRTCRFWTPLLLTLRSEQDTQGKCMQHDERTWATGACGDHLYRDDRASIAMRRRVVKR